MQNELLMKLFGTDDEKTILDAKIGKTQQREFGTKRLSPVKLSADQCKKLCESAGVEYMAGYESRVLEYVITDETVDRYGDIVRAKGVQTKNYKNNPVVVRCHQTREFPVGTSLKIWFDSSDKTVKAWGMFYDDRVDRTGMSETVFRFASTGAMRMASIGFMPIETHEMDKEEKQKLGMPSYGVEFTKVDLLEWSPVTVPANPNAGRKDFEGVEQKHIDTARENELFTKEVLDHIEKLINEEDPIEKMKRLADEFDKDLEDDSTNKPGFEETENEIRFRVREPGKFNKDTLRFVALKKSKPRVNSVMGKLKGKDKPADPMILQALRFPKEDGWTVAKAKKWVKDHPNVVKDIEGFKIIEDPDDAIIHNIEWDIQADIDAYEVKEVEMDAPLFEVRDVEGNALFTITSTTSATGANSLYWVPDNENSTITWTPNTTQLDEALGKRFDELTEKLEKIAELQAATNDVLAKAIDRLIEAHLAVGPEKDGEGLYDALSAVNRLTK